MRGAAAWVSPYPVSALASAAVATLGAAITALSVALNGDRPELVVERARADSWFRQAVRPVGWETPAAWDSVAGDYATRDGWIRLHTNAAHHRRAALDVLGCAADRDEVAAAVSRWDARELEDGVVAAGGCAAELRSPQEWAAHPQGRAVAAEPLVDITSTGAGTAVATAWRPAPNRPLAGLRVLDLTRVLAGPVATRALAGLGAEVLRIDPPWWDEESLELDMTLGKRCARLDLRDPAARDQLERLLARADVLVHGYRPGALDRLGLDAVTREHLRPGLVEVSLSAYGHTGPWASRRGFDSLVQMSSGIAAEGLLAGRAERPTPLPVQALDHATGWLMAAAVVAGLAARQRDGMGTRRRLSLARTAAELERARSLVEATPSADNTSRGDDRGGATQVVTPWGPAEILAPPIAGPELRLAWDLAPRPLGSDAPVWLD